MRVQALAAPPLGLIAAGASAVVVAAVAATASRRKQQRPQVQGQNSGWNDAMLSLCPSLTEPYSLPDFLHSGHVETIFAAVFRSKPHVLYDRELLHMPDGGCVALDQEDLPDGKRLPADAPVLIILPGLSGGSGDSYVQHAVVHARKAGIRAVVFNSRGTSGSPVLTAQLYSASYTGDLRNVVAHVRSRYPDSILCAAGYSVGANLLTRYLGEDREGTPISAAVALCNPFDLMLSRQRLRSGFSQIYSRSLARSLKRIFTQHQDLFEQEAATPGGRPYKSDLALSAKRIIQFDEAITRVSFGWPDALTYYAEGGSSGSIPHVQVPLLIIQAENDPISPIEAIPFAAIQANPHCMLVLTPTGGHLGWCGGKGGIKGAPWSDAAVTEYLAAARQLLAQPEFTPAAAQRQRKAGAEPPGVYAMGESTHQAP